MILVLTGDNLFLRRERLAALVSRREVSRRDGEQLTRADLLDLIQGQSLFGDQVIVIDELSANKELWDVLPEIEAGDTTLILLETKLDKRTKTYKWLLKNAKVEQLESFGERDSGKVIQWVTQRAATTHNLTLDRGLAQTIVARLGHDQLRLDNFLTQLVLAEKVDAETIDTLLPLATSENVFALFAAALRGERQRVHQIIRYLEFSSGDDGAYQTLGLLASQAMNLTALVLADGDSAKVAADLGVNPYALRSLTAQARATSRGQLRELNHALFLADQQMKSTTVNPWLILETALVLDTEKTA